MTVSDGCGPVLGARRGQAGEDSGGSDLRATVASSTEGWDPSWVTTCLVGRRLQGAQPGICVAGCALRLVPPPDYMAPGGRLGAMRSGVALGLIPSRPSPSGPHYWKADLWFLPWTRIGQTRCRVGTQK
jgi:hypothetical protein